MRKVNRRTVIQSPSLTLLIHPAEEELIDQLGQLLLGVTVTDTTLITQMYKVNLA